MHGKIASHIRNNIVGYLALFVALNAGAYAVTIAPRNSVRSSSIRNGQVKTVDLANRAVTNPKLGSHAVNAAKVDSSQVQLRVGQNCSPGSAIRDISASGTVTCQADTIGPSYTANSPLTLSGTAFGLQSCTSGEILKFTTSWACAADSTAPTGSAGGDLTGTYPAPTIGDGKVVGGTGGNVADDSLTGADINEATLNLPPADIWHDFQTPADCSDGHFCNNYQNIGAGFQNAGYFRDRDGMVHLRGVVKCSSSCGNNVIFALPPGYLVDVSLTPASELFPVLVTGETIGRLKMATSGIGTVTSHAQLETGDPSGYVSLSGVSIRCTTVVGNTGCP